MPLSRSIAAQSAGTPCWRTIRPQPCSHCDHLAHWASSAVARWATEPPTKSVRMARWTNGRRGWSSAASSATQSAAASEAKTLLVPLNVAGIPASVSYTHLDVYKRQEVGRPGKVPLWVVALLPPRQEPMQGDRVEQGLEGVMAVSYTHLDVYKRQFLTRDEYEQLLADGRLVAPGSVSIAAALIGLWRRGELSV